MDSHIIREGLLTANEFLKELREESKRLCLIVDENLLNQGKNLSKSLASDLFVVPSGEACKTREVKQQIEDFLLSKGFGRDTLLIALGGGSVGDLVGFVASTYCRGVDFINIPSTLLAMVDACHGGKTAINTPHGKNMIGSLWPAKKTYVDPLLLKTLSDVEVACGAMEMIKHGIIHSAAYFERIEKGENLLSSVMIYDSLSIKHSICELDPHEKAQRYLLNFGHTIGHALETLYEYKVPHGMAVGLGMKAEAYLSYLLGFLSKEAFLRICSLIDMTKKWTLPEKVPSVEQILSTMERDKKALKGEPRFSILEDIGTPHTCNGSYCMRVDVDYAKSAVQWLIDNCR